MNFLLLADIEGYTPEFAENFFDTIEFVVIAGDISIGAKNVERNAKFYQRIRDKIPIHILVYYVPGNREYENVASEFEGIPKKFIPLHNRIIIHILPDGRKIHLLGLGGALPGFFNNMVFTEEEIADKLENLFKNLSVEDADMIILVTHNPPYSDKLAMTFGGKNIGSHAIHAIIEKYNPTYCVCGHVHESPGIEVIGTTKCVNPGASKQGNAAILSLESELKIELISIDAHRLKSK